MAFLLNRKYGSRLECLYYILKSCYHTFGNTDFSMTSMKFDSTNPHNVHAYCSLLNQKLGIKFCPYLENPLNPSKCYATQSIDSDSTKSKAISDVANSLVALGFLNRTNDTLSFTNSGIAWVNTEFGDDEWENLALHGVLSYGPTLSFLHALNESSDKTVKYSVAYLGYPKTIEKVMWNDEEIELSTDSTDDSNTRTRSKILSWCVTVGLLSPSSTVSSIEKPCLRFRDFVNSDRITVRTFTKTDLFYSIINTKHHVANPLSYKNLHKNIGSLRERNMTFLREATLNYNTLILNRRFILVYILNKFSQLNLSVDFNQLVEEMLDYKEYFFTDASKAYEIIGSETDICSLAGIPFLIENNKLVPLTTVSEEVLTDGAPNEIIQIANTILERLLK